jgi:uncharacterized membrane-anchored protein
MFGLLYILINGCYYLGGGTNPYNGAETLYVYLNWDEEPGMAFLKGLAVVALGMIIWILLFGIYLIRTYIYSKIYKDVDEEWTEIP